MKKILFVSVSNLDSNNYAGDTVRANNLINFLRKKNIVDLLCLSNNKILLKRKKFYKIKSVKGNRFFFKKYNFFLRLFYSFISLLKFKPLQLGFFYSKELKNFIIKNHQNYKTIIFHLTRSCQYLPKNFTGNKVLEMTDLMSENYKQTKFYLSLTNPFFYLYFIEYFLIKNYEKYCFNKFKKIVLVSKKDLNKSLINKKKFFFISNGVKVNKKIYKYNKKNYKIIFIGNINYLPNNFACLEFAKKILPILNKKNPNIKFYIIGKISVVNKLKFIFIKNVKVLGEVQNLDKHLSKSICGISNLNIATGIQNKILTYASYGLPTISSAQSSKGIQHLSQKTDFMIYKNDKDFINKIQLLKKNSLIANKISNNSYSKIYKLNWNNILKKYNKII